MSYHRSPAARYAGSDRSSGRSALKSFGRLLTLLGMLLSLMLIGMIGIHLTTGRPWLESAYLAIITLTTLGSRDVPEDSTDMIFVMVYLLCGLSIFTYGAFQLGQIIVTAELRGVWESRKMQSKIDQISGHFIICGQGRMGRAICEYLSAKQRPFVVIDRNEEALFEICRDRGWLCIGGDATQDDILLAAGIERAHSLATALPSDSENTYVVLTARMLNEKIQIVTRANDDDAVVKLQRAGATRVISPFSSGAVKMARFMINPSIEEFLEITDSRGSGLELVEMQISEESPYFGKRLAETDLRERGMIVIGIRRADGEVVTTPSASTEIETGDCLFLFGSAHSVQAVLSEQDD